METIGQKPIKIKIKISGLEDLRKEFQKELDVIIKSRDKLREMLGDIQDVDYMMTEVVDDFEHLIDRMSEKV